MQTKTTPTIDLDAFRHLQLSYDPADDIAYIHLDGPRAALTEQVDDGWYLRIAEGESVGMELHGLFRLFLSTPFYAGVFAPALRELEQATGHSVDGGLEISASVDELPKTAQLVVLLLGQAVAKLDALQRIEAEDAGKALLAS